MPAWRADAAVAPPGYRPERNRAALVGREAELGLLGHSVENAVRNARASLLLLLGEAGVGKSRLAEELACPPSASTTPSCSRAAASPTARPTSGGRSPTPCATAAGIRSSDPADKAIELARTSVCIALGEEASPAEVDRVHQGLLYLMGYDSELRGDRPGPRPRGGHLRRGHLRRAVLAPAAGRGGALRPPLGRRPRARARRHAPRPAVQPALRGARHRPPGRRGALAPAARSPQPGRAHARPAHGRARRSCCSSELAGAELGTELSPTRCSTAAAATPSSSRSSSPCWPTPGMVGADGAPTEPTPSHVELPDTLRGLVAARLDGLTADERRVLDDCAVLGRRGPMMAIEVMAGKHLGIDDVRPVLESLEAKELLVLSGSRGGREVDVPLRPRARGRLQHPHEGRPGPIARRHRRLDGGARGHRPRRGGRPDHATTTCAPPS